MVIPESHYIRRNNPLPRTRYNKFSRTQTCNPNLSHQEHFKFTMKLRTIFVAAVLALGANAITCDGPCGTNYESPDQYWYCETACSGCVCRCAAGDKYALC